jgi:hypothetical protein
MDKTLDALLTRFSGLEKELQDAAYERDCLKRERDNLQGQKDRLAKEVTCLQETQSRHNFERFETHKTIVDLTKERDKYKEACDIFHEMWEKVNDILGRPLKDPSPWNDLVPHVRELKDENQRLQEENDRLCSNKKLAADLAIANQKDAAEQVAKWKKASDEWKLSYTNARERLEKEVARLEQSNAQFRAELSAAQFQISQLKEMDEALKPKIKLYPAFSAVTQPDSHPDKATEDLWRERIQARILHDRLRNAPDAAFCLGSYGDWFKNRFNNIWPDRATLIRVLSADQSSSGEAEAVLANPEPSDDRSRQGFSLKWLRNRGFPHVVVGKLYWVRATEHHTGQWSCTGTWLTPIPSRDVVPVCHTLKKRLGLGKGHRYTIEIIGPVNPETGEFTEEEPDTKPRESFFVPGLGVWPSPSPPNRLVCGFLGLLLGKSHR